MEKGSRGSGCRYWLAYRKRLPGVVVGSFRTDRRTLNHPEQIGVSSHICRNFTTQPLPRLKFYKRTYKAVCNNISGKNRIFFS